jgi:peptidoglycan pentaglycine glycine transferase (the first glycine)
MTIVREIGETERQYWNTQIQRFKSAHPLNAFEWGMVRSVDGWTPIYLCAERDGEFRGAMMILKKRLPCTPFTILHAQKMPVWDQADDETIAALLKAASQIGRRDRAIFLRITPNIPESSAQGLKDKLVGLGLRHLEQRWSYWNSPRDLLRVDLTQAASPEDMFSRLGRSARRDIRRAQREEFTVERATTKEESKAFYRVFHEFTIEKGFMARSYEYQEKLWETYLQQGMGRLLLAKYRGEIAGGAIDLAFAGKCLHMHVGAPRRYRDLHINDALVWEGIRWAKENDCSWYSFRGVGSTTSQEVFKRKFNPTVVSLIGYFDLPFMPLLYKLFYWAEFTLLPFSWPFIIWARKLANRLISKP